MARRIFLFHLLSWLSLLGFAQHTNILISTQNNPSEPSIAINPRNTQQLVAGSVLNNVYTSVDGGLTWTEDTLYSTSGVWGDPTIIVDTAGSFYYFHLSAPAGYSDSSWLDRIVCQKADTLGAVWNDGSYTAINGLKDQDKQWAVVDPRDNTIYLTWTQFDEYASYLDTDSTHIMFTKSTDGGLSWTPSLRIDHIGGDCIDEDNTVEGAVPAVGPNGEVYVAWAGPVGIVFDRSLDAGSTWLDNDIFVSDQPGGWDYNVPGIMRANGLPVTCCDLSNGPNRGTIYINWTDHRNGPTDTDVWLAKSTDGGNTWSAPKRVNDDSSSRRQFFTWMCVDQATGYLYFVFYDRRNYSDNRTDVYMAVSKDGGETFTNFCISESPFDPYSSIFFGDYTNITAHNNVVRPIWVRLDGADLGIYTALIDSVFLGVERQDLEESQDIEIYPNPFTVSSFISFKLAISTLVTLKVFDINGRVVATPIDGVLMERGKYIEQIDAIKYGLLPGVYYYQLFRGTQLSIRKIVLN